MEPILSVIVPVKKIKGAARQCYGDGDGVVRCEQIFSVTVVVEPCEQVIASYTTHLLRYKIAVAIVPCVNSSLHSTLRIRREAPRHMPNRNDLIDTIMGDGNNKLKNLFM